MKLLGALLIGIVMGVWAFREPVWYQANKIAELSAENERLKLFHAREKRRFEHPEAKVDAEAVSMASHILGTPSSVIAAIWMQENGPPDIETGVLGRTDYFAKNFDMRYWPALEASRTMNIYVYKWLLSKDGEKAWKAILERASKPYTKDTKAKDWANNIAKIEKTLRQPR